MSTVKTVLVWTMQPIHSTDKANMMHRLDCQVTLPKIAHSRTTRCQWFQCCLIRSMTTSSSPTMKTFGNRHYSCNYKISSYFNSIYLSNNNSNSNSISISKKSKFRWLKILWPIIMRDNTSNAKSSSSETTFSLSAKINNKEGTTIRAPVSIMVTTPTTKWTHQILLTTAPWCRQVEMQVRLIIEWACLVNRRYKVRHNHCRRLHKMLHS